MIGYRCGLGELALLGRGQYRTICAGVSRARSYMVSISYIQGKISFPRQFNRRQAAQRTSLQWPRPGRDKTASGPRRRMENLMRSQSPRKPVSAGTLYSFMWRQRDRGVVPVVTNRDLRRTWKTLAGKAGVPKEIRDRLQNHILQDVSSKSYDRWFLWSEWQDLNLRPPRPERGPPHENLMISASYDDVRGRSFTFGCGISVGKLSGDGSEH